MTVGDNASNGNIWFQINGTIEDISNNDDRYTEWFMYNGFSTTGQTYIWQEYLTNVGQANGIYILSQQDDSLRINTITIDNGIGNSRSYTVTSPSSGALIHHSAGMNDK